MTNETEFENLLAQCDAAAAAMRIELEAMRPRLIQLKELYTAYIDSIRFVLFVAAPSLQSGGHANLPPRVEKECEAAVVAVLKRHLAKVNKALGETQ